jgi:single-strand DNA-binding protein
MAEEASHRNEVTLVGRLAGEIRERPMPSGALLCSFRLVVRRETAAHGPNIDALDCIAWLATVRRAVLRWSVGDLIEVRGAVRRRFWRGVSGPASRCEIEVGLARRLARAGAGAGVRKIRATRPSPSLPTAGGSQPAGPPLIRPSPTSSA